MICGCKEMAMQERKGVITVKGDPLTLIGEDISIGDTAPDFEVLDGNLAAVKLSAYRGKVCIISSVPSLDTPVCDTMTRRFNEAADALGDDIVILTISMDLPFAQKRWCGAAGVESVQTLSDHRDAAFGQAFGLLIKELRLLARAVFVVDKQGVIRYKEIVSELTEEPNYDAALEAAKKLL
jgi:thiol peroxidase